jgi:nitroreductase
MIDRSTIEKIISLGAMAPSGGNSKPWQFRIHEDAVEIFALPEKDHRILNFRNRGTWIAHGALIENMAVGAGSYGYEAVVMVFPEKEQLNLTARIMFRDAAKYDEALAAAIPNRATNRKTYTSDPLAIAEKEALLGAAQKNPGARMELIEDREKLRILGAASSVNEILTFEDRRLHALFIHEIAWTVAEEKARGGGLFLKTMELPPPQEFVLTHLLRHWNTTRVMGKLGFARMIARDNAKIYSQAAAVGAIMVPDTDSAFIDAGRVMERVWLEATRLGLSVQLMTGILFMHQRISAGDPFGLSQKHIKMAEKAYADIVACVRPKGTIPALLFRIGRGDAPSAYSIKTPPTYIE